MDKMSVLLLEINYRGRGGEVIRHQLNYLLIINFLSLQFFLHYDSAKSFISIGFASKFLCAFIHSIMEVLTRAFYFPPLVHNRHKSINHGQGCHEATLTRTRTTLCVCVCVCV